jgi:hypothetical protein
MAQLTVLKQSYQSGLSILGGNNRRRIELAEISKMWDIRDPWEHIASIGTPVVLQKFLRTSIQLSAEGIRLCVASKSGEM